MSASRDKYKHTEDYYDRDRHFQHSSKYDDRKVDRKRYKDRDSHRSRSRSPPRYRRRGRSRSRNRNRNRNRSRSLSLGRKLMALSLSERSDEETGHKKKLIAEKRLSGQHRIKEGRAKPIDLLTRYINAFGDDIGAEEEVDKTEQMAAESVEPYFHLNGLRIADLKDLAEDIKVYMTLDSDKNSDYWETLLSRLKAHIARARLKEMHEQNLIRRSNRMRAQQNAQKNVKKESNLPIFPIEEQINQTKEEEEPTASVSFEDADNETPVEENISQQMDPTIKCVEDYKSGQYSPKYLSICEIESGILITQPEEDFRLLENQRKQVMRTEAIQNHKKPTLTAEEAAFEKEARKGMTNEEVIFSVEEEIIKIDKMYSWSDEFFDKSLPSTQIRRRHS